MNYQRPLEELKLMKIISKSFGKVLEYFFQVNTLFRALILKFKPRLENRCKLFPVYTLFRASILDFKPKLENRCKDFLVSGLLRASILDFRPRLGNRCSAIAATVRNGPPAVVVAATRSASDSNFFAQRRMARLQHNRGAQAGTGCHEGGIILSKKPPEWLLSLPQQRSASDSILRCGKGE